MNEEIVAFGERKNLHGILTTPSSEHGKLPLIVFWNAGLIAKTGVHRIQVLLARKFAELGFSTLRFDLSGVGDSYNVSYQEKGDKTDYDLKQAIEYGLSKIGGEKSILIGFCSGALNAHELMLTEDKVAGSILIDSYGYKTRKYFFYYFLKLFRFSKWIRPFLILLMKIIGTNKVAPESQVAFWDFPPREKVKEDLQQLVNKDLKLYYIYTNGVLDYYNYKNQFYDMFKGVDFKDCVELDFFENSDHLFTPLKEKKELMERIISWTTRQFGCS